LEIFKPTVTSSSVLIALENGGQENIGEILQTENSENTIGHLCNSDDSACPSIILSKINLVFLIILNIFYKQI